MGRNKQEEEQEKKAFGGECLVLKAQRGRTRLFESGTSAGWWDNQRLRPEQWSPAWRTTGSGRESVGVEGFRPSHCLHPTFRPATQAGPSLSVPEPAGVGMTHGALLAEMSWSAAQAAVRTAQTFALTSPDGPPTFLGIPNTGDWI